MGTRMDNQGFHFQQGTAFQLINEGGDAFPAQIGLRRSEINQVGRVRRDTDNSAFPAQGFECVGFLFPYFPTGPAIGVFDENLQGIAIQFSGFFQPLCGFRLLSTCAHRGGDS